MSQPEQRLETEKANFAGLVNQIESSRAKIYHTDELDYFFRHRGDGVIFEQETGENHSFSSAELQTSNGFGFPCWNDSLPRDTAGQETYAEEGMRKKGPS